MVICEENMHRYTLLTQVVRALNSLCSSLCMRNYRQQKRRQNSDDGDDSQKLNQGEGRMFAREAMPRPYLISLFLSMANN